MNTKDLHYLIDYEQSSRQFRYQAYDDACILMHRRYYAGKFQIMLDDHGILFSHAGVTNTWMEKRCVSSGDNPEAILRSLSYYADDTSGFGANIYQSPCWIRPGWAIPKTYKDMLGWQTLEDDPWSSRYQIVGHTRTKQVMKIDNIIYCDCLALEHVLIEISDEGEIKFKAVNSKTLEQRSLV